MALIQVNFLQGWIIQPGFEHVAPILKLWLVAEWRPEEKKSAYNPTGAENRVNIMKIVASCNSSWGQKPEIVHV